MTSSSIYAVRMPGPLGDVVNQLNGLRPLVAQKAAALIAREIARVATIHYDRAMIFGKDVSQDFIAHAQQNVAQRMYAIRQTNNADPAVDTSFEIIIADDREFAIMLSYTAHLDWFKDLLSLPGATDFSYWDGAERPETVTEEDWEKRRRTFQRILSRDPYGRPGGCGISHTFLPPLEAPTLEAIMMEIPNDTARALQIARDERLRACLISHQERFGTPPAVMDITDYMIQLDEPDTFQEIQTRADEILSDLHPLTVEGLTGHNPAPSDDSGSPCL